MYLDESFFDTFPKEVKYNQYVVIDAYGTFAECYMGAYYSEIEAYKIYKKASSKSRRLLKLMLLLQKQQIENG